MKTTQHIFELIIEDPVSSKFHVRARVPQSCFLSSILLWRICDEENSWPLGFSISDYRINNLRYADNIILIATSMENLEELIKRVETASEIELKLNCQKAKVMIIERENNNRIFFKWQNTKWSQNLYIWGRLIEWRRLQYGDTEADRDGVPRLDSQGRIFNNTMMSLVQFLVFSFYRTETWMISQKDHNYINAYEMWCWRRMLRIL